MASEALARGTIFRGPASWMIDLREDPTADETRALFGSTILPLPFTLAASLDRVVLSLRRQHPAIVIRFAEPHEVAARARPTVREAAG
jgi:hypothetical protein